MVAAVLTYGIINIALKSISRSGQCDMGLCLSAVPCLPKMLKLFER